MIGIRGATSIEEDTKDDIKARVSELMDRIFDENEISEITTLMFTVTPDIKALNPATVARMHLKRDNLSLMCLQEATFENSVEGIIRVLILCESQTNNSVYLHRASNLKKAFENNL